jgi:hypothetical protein
VEPREKNQLDGGGERKKKSVRRRWREKKKSIQKNEPAILKLKGLNCGNFQLFFCLTTSLTHMAATTSSSSVDTRKHAFASDDLRDAYEHVKRLCTASNPRATPDEDEASANISMLLDVQSMITDSIERNKEVLGKDCFECCKCKRWVPSFAHIWPVNDTAGRFPGKRCDDCFPTHSEAGSVVFTGGRRNVCCLKLEWVMHGGRVRTKFEPIDTDPDEPLTFATFRTTVGDLFGVDEFSCCLVLCNENEKRFNLGDKTTYPDDEFVPTNLFPKHECLTIAASCEHGP